MRKKRLKLMIMAILLFVIEPGFVYQAADAAGNVVTKSYTATEDTMELDGHIQYDGIHGNDGDATYRPELIVTYETGPVNNPPVGSFTIAEGAMTSTRTVNLSVTGSDPDAGDSVTHMRFANSAANLSAASWLPFSNTATFSLAGGDGSKTIYMQLRDSNNGISTNSSQTILLDQTAPIGTLIINDGATWTKTDMVTLKGTYTDGSGSGVDEVRHSNFSGSWQTSWFSIADLNGKSWDLPEGEGAKTVYVQYKDKARAGASTNASLSNLKLSKGTLSPTFDKVKARYTVSVPFDTANLNVTAIVEDSKASLKVSGSDVSSGAVKQMPLSVGLNVIEIVVTAQDGATKKVYTIEVTREKQQLSAPTDVKAFAGDRSVTISFTASANNGGSQITHYEVVSSTGVIVATGTSSPITITGLTNGMTYTFSVRAVNREGAGVLSIASNASTPHGSSSSSGSGSDSGSSLIDNPISTTNGKLTLPAGVAGETKLDDEIIVSIPVGASDRTLRLIVEKVLDTVDLAKHGEVFASPVFELLKNFSDNFKKPVTLTMKFDPSKVKTGQRASIFYFDETNKIWIEVGGQVRGNTITATIDHFTKFAVLVVNDASEVPEQESE